MSNDDSKDEPVFEELLRDRADRGDWTPEKPPPRQAPDPKTKRPSKRPRKQART